VATDDVEAGGEAAVVHQPDAALDVLDVGSHELDRILQALPDQARDLNQVGRLKA
jgi:hypothetical protein